MSLGYKLQDGRKSLKLSVEALGEKTGLSSGTIRAFEQGRRFPSAESLRLLEGIIDLGGSWTSDDVWIDDEGDEHVLAPHQGGHPRVGRVNKNDHSVNRQAATHAQRRLDLIQKILEADPETIKAINMLLK